MMRIFFIGMPGSGKSTIAKEFAKRINADFIDTDNYIELKYNLKIPKIFKKYGEAKFREFENLALKELVKKNNIVVATGGGTPCYNNNMELMNNLGKTIYLKVATEILFNRILSDENIRPLIQNKSDEEVKLYLTKTLNNREKFYNQAKFIIGGDDETTKIVELISPLIKHF